MVEYNLFDYFIRYLSRDPNGPNILALDELRHQIMALLIALQGIFLLVTFVYSVFMSHRIAGPLFKLCRFLAMARDGNLKEELYFREKDHFQEIATGYNDAMKGIRTRMEDAASDVEKALPDSSPAARSSLERALTKLRGLQP